MFTKNRSLHNHVGYGLDVDELTILLPCLNEAETLAICIKKAQRSLSQAYGGSVLVADNGSTDGSQDIASSMGARVISVTEKGYGAALRAGILAAESKYILMADADDSYALDDIGSFLQELRKGADLVMGNRFEGGIDRDAMPWLHRYIGNPILSFIGRTLYSVKVRDFHCGMRGFNLESMRELNLRCPGMEFASEMVVKSAIAHNTIAEVPTTLKKDGRSRKPHLRTWRDGWRHLVFLLAWSPTWLLLYPGLFMEVLGFAGLFLSAFSLVPFPGVHFDLNTYFYSIGFILFGLQLLGMAAVAFIHMKKNGFESNMPTISKFHRKIVANYSPLIAGLLILLSASIGMRSISAWIIKGFGPLALVSTLKITGIAILLGGSGLTLLFFYFLNILIMDY